MHSLKFLIGSGEATPGGVLAPVLAPYGLDLLQISKEINFKTGALYLKGVPVPVRLFIVAERQYRIEVLPPTLGFLYNNLAASAAHPSKLTVVELYNLFLLFCNDRAVSTSSVAASTFFGFLLSLSPPPVFILSPSC